MSSLECLREFVNERLAAAAAEIYGVFEKAIAEYEEEIDRQRKLLDAVWEPEIRLHRIDQQRMERETNSSVDQEEPVSQHIKEEEEELCTTPEGEQLVLKQETDTYMLTPTCEESCHREPELNSDHQLLSNNSHVADSRDQIGDTHGVSVSRSADAEPKPKRRCRKSNSDHQLLSNSSHVAEKQNLKRGEHGNSRPATKAKPKPTKRHCKSRIHSNKVNNHTMSKIDCKTGKKSFKCDTCGKSWISQSKLKIHVRIHTDEKPYPCKECGRSFKQKTHLKSHMRIHTDEKPYSCKECGRSFKQNIHLKNHMRIHTGETPYSCEECARSFKLIVNLKSHMRIHTGEKSYSCKECAKSFKHSASLNYHMKIHTAEKPYSCKECGKSFRVKGRLVRHMRTHSGKKLYVL